MYFYHLWVKRRDNIFIRINKVKIKHNYVLTHLPYTCLYHTACYNSLPLALTKGYGSSQYVLYIALGLFFLS